MHLILLDLVIRRKFCEQYRSLSYSLCIFLHSPVTSSVLGPNLLLNTLFSNTFSLRSSLSVSDQVSHPYKTTGKVIVLYILIFKFLDSNWKTTDSAPNYSKHRSLEPQRDQNTSTRLPRIASHQPRMQSLFLCSVLWYQISVFAVTCISTKLLPSRYPSSHLPLPAPFVLCDWLCQPAQIFAGPAWRKGSFASTTFAALNIWPGGGDMAIANL